MHGFFVLSGLFAFFFLSGFALTSFNENEKRAGLLATVISFGFVVCWFGFGSLVPGYSIGATILFWLLLLAVVVGLYLPVGKSIPLVRIPEKTERFDERHTIFGRMCLEEGTWQYEEYYNNLNPKMKSSDDRLREMPALGASGGKYADPLDSPYVDAVFGFISKFNHLADPGMPENKPVKVTPEEAARRLKGFGRQMGAKDLRITRLKDHHVYTHAGRHPHNWGEEYHRNHKFVVVFTTEMDHEMVQCAPLAPSSVETAVKYMTAANIGIALATYIKELGYEARAHIDGNYQVINTAIAHEAGIGELSRLGLIITKGEGARIRIALVTTNLPLVEDEPVDLGVQHFCEICKKCAVNCPSGSIDHGNKKEIRGVVKWQTNQETCYQFWRRFGTDCTICVAVCPYSKPDTFYHKLIKVFIIRNALARRLALFLDDFFYSRTPRHTKKPDWFTKKHEETGLKVERSTSKSQNT